MATLQSTRYFQRETHGGGRKDVPPGQATHVEVSIAIPRGETHLIPLRLAAVFGPEGHYDSHVLRLGGEVTITYRMSDRPFGQTDPEKVADAAIAHFNRVLDERRARS